MPYKVMVDDNFHFMDEDERTEAGTFETTAEAVEAAKTIVLKSLRWNYKQGMTAEKLYSTYQAFGDDPFVFPRDDKAPFSAWEYAKTMCAQVCEEQSKIKKQ